MLLTLMVFILEGIFSFILNCSLTFSEYHWIFVLFCGVLLGITTIISIVRTEDISTTEKIIVMVSFLIMCALVIVDRNYKPLDLTDSDFFHAGAVNFAQTGDLGSGRSAGLYGRLVGAIYYVFGEYRIFAQLVNIVLATEAELLFFKLTNKIEVIPKCRLILGLFACFNPNFLIVSSVLRREAVICFLITYSLYFFIYKWWQNGDRCYFYMAVLSGLVAAVFHSGVIILVAAYMLIFSLLDRANMTLVFRTKTILVLSVCVFFFLLLNATYGDIIFAKFNVLNNIDSFTNRMSTGRGGSGYDIKVNLGNNLLNAIISTPLRMLYFAISPMPWDWRGITDILAFLSDSIVYVMMLWYGIIAFFKKQVEFVHSERIKALIICWMLVSLIFGWGVRNAGTAMRHRDKFIFMNACIVAMCLQKDKKRKKRFGCL